MVQKPSPKPIAIMGYAIIFLTFGVFGGWAAVAKLDSAVVAPGTISLQGNRRVVQHLEGGIVAEILVQEADVVSQGDVIIRLRDVEARSNLEVLENRLKVLSVIEARLNAERRMKDNISIPEALQIENAPQAVQDVIADQIDLFKDQRSILKSQTDILTSRVEQIHVQIEGLNLQKSALERRMSNYTTLLERMRDGSERGLIEKNSLAQREDDLIQIESNLGQIISDIAQATNVIGETEHEKLRTVQEYRQRANSELEDISAQIAELTERAKVAQDVLNRTEIRSPGSGTIQDLQVHTVGSVIRAGEILMELIPEDEQLVINARVSPTDIDNVSPGLATEVRFTAFKSKLTPIVLGSVQTVSEDVITPENPNDLPFYLARIDVNKEDVPEGVRDRLTAGMPADVIITTGERTVINYIASPLFDAIRKSMLEE
jgi:membrane fusion protein, type I secretion system